MKKYMITALLITTMISMTACGGKNTDTPAEETVVATSETVENPTANDEKVVLGTLNKEETATAETTTEEKTDAKATTSPDPKATEAPKATATPKATPTPTAAPVACQHTNTHVENSHDTYEVPIAGGCYEVWRTATRVCNDCGANLGEAPEKVNEVHHGCVVKQGVSATCTTDGYTAVESCDCRGRGEVGGDVIPAFGHDYVDEWDHDETDADGKDHVYFHSICRNCGDISSVWEE